MEYEAFATEHVDRLLRLARLLTGHREEAEDLVQESLARAYVKWTAVSRAEHPLAYVRRLMVNLHTSRARRPVVRAVPLEAVLEPAAVGGAASLEDSDQLRAAVLALPDRQRTVLVLRYYEELDVAEVADATGLRAASVRSALARALATLRTTMEEPDA